MFIDFYSKIFIRYRIHLLIRLFLLLFSVCRILSFFRILDFSEFDGPLFLFFHHLYRFLLISGWINLLQKLEFPALDLGAWLRPRPHHLGNALFACWALELKIELVLLQLVGPLNFKTHAFMEIGKLFMLDTLR